MILEGVHASCTFCMFCSADRLLLGLAACLIVPLTTWTFPLPSATNMPLLLVFLRSEYDAHASSCTPAINHQACSNASIVVQCQSDSSHANSCIPKTPHKLAPMHPLYRIPRVRSQQLCRQPPHDVVLSLE